MHPMDNAQTTPIEIFRAGQHTDMHGREFNVSSDDLARIAQGYNPALLESPLVIGHPQLNAPAYGWVKGLRAEGDTLLADAHQVDAAFAAAVKAGRYKKRSAAFLLPDAPGNPTPGQFYLQHVGFLGAQRPAVMGLRDVQFAAPGEHVAEFSSDRRWGFREIAGIFRRLRDWLIERDGMAAADSLIPSWQIDSLVEAALPDAEPAPLFSAPTDDTQEIDVSESKTAAFAAREQALSQQAAELLAREQALAAREQETRRADAAAFAAELVQSGRLLPRQAATVTEILLVLPEDQPLAFAGDDGNTTEVRPAEALRALLSDLPTQIDYREKSHGSTAAAPAAFAAPAGELVDPTGLALHNKALAYQQSHPGTAYLTAVKAVGG